MSVPIYNFTIANEGLNHLDMEQLNPCCGHKLLFYQSGDEDKGNRPCCKAERMKRVDINDAGAIHMLGNHYHLGKGGLQQDQAKAMELWKQSEELGSSDSEAHLTWVCINMVGGI